MAKQPASTERPSYSAQGWLSEQESIEALFASIGEGIVATDSHGIITRANQVALDILGYKKENELVGKWFPETIIALKSDGSIIDSLDRPIEKVFLTGKTVTEQHYYLTQKGTVVPVSVTVSPIMVKGRPVGAIQAFRDISLEVQSDKLKTEFISIASHQLRTPLTAINMYAQMLSDGLAGEISANQRTFLDVIVSSIARMNALINTLLNITRIEAGTITINPIKTDITNLLRELIQEFSPEATNKEINLRTKIKSENITLNTDGLLVKEIVANLISNALKFTPKKGTITVSLYEERNNIIFKVKDTGYGIPKVAQTHIFSKFFRADNITSQDVSGTGLGLYLTKTIAENLNGEIWFESAENKGSTFYFTLPKEGSIARKGKFRLDTK